MSSRASLGTPSPPLADSAALPPTDIDSMDVEDSLLIGHETPTLTDADFCNGACREVGDDLDGEELD